MSNSVAALALAHPPPEKVGAVYGVVYRLNSNVLRMYVFAHDLPPNNIERARHYQDLDFPTSCLCIHHYPQCDFPGIDGRLLTRYQPKNIFFRTGVLEQSPKRGYVDWDPER